MNSENEILFENLVKTIYEANERQTGTLKTEIQAEISVVKTEIHELKTLIQEGTKKITQLEKKQTDLENKYQTIEKVLKKNNIVIFGLECGNSENLAEYVVTKLNSWFRLNLTLACVNNIYQIGKPDVKRPILLQFVSYLTKTQVLKECKKLKGTGISISQDLTKEEREINKILLKHKRQAQDKGYTAYIKKYKLYINNEEYTPEALEKYNIEEPESNRQQDIPKSRRTLSAPTTPVVLHETESEDETEEGNEDENVNEIISEKEANENTETRNLEEDLNSKKRKITSMQTEKKKRKKQPFGQITHTEKSSLIIPNTRSTTKISSVPL